MSKLSYILLISLFVYQISAACTAGQYAGGVNNTCISCGVGAATCTASKSYQTCASGFYTTAITSDEVACTTCNATTSITCTSGVVATACQEGYSLKHGRCLACGIDYLAACASTCSTSGFVTSGAQCVSCESDSSSCRNGCDKGGFYTDSASSSCLRCPEGNAECSSSVKALKCAMGYYLASGAVCVKLPESQKTLTLTSIATSCLVGSYLNTTTNTCETCSADAQNPCQADCLRASYVTNATSCVACVTYTDKACLNGCENRGFFTESTTSGQTTTTQCKACASNTLTCTSATIATSCVSGYFLDKAGVCTVCTSTDSNLNTCVARPLAISQASCAQGYFINQTECISCQTTTESCSAHCLTNGYFTEGVVGTNATCKACETGSNACTNETYSTDCFVGFYLQYATCVAVPTGTYDAAHPVSTTCLDSFYLTNSKCESCQDATIKTCQNGGPGVADSSTGCMTGYSELANSCVQCSSGASTCDGLRVLECAANYQFKDGGCISCGSNVASCTSSSEALSCDAGYYLNAGSCSACSDTTNVVTCSGGTSSDHLTCGSGYFLSSGQCTACTNNAVTCTSTSVHLTCQTGYALIGSSTVCATCGFDLASVLTCSTTKQHSTCASGYYYLTSKKLCIPCPANSATCTPSFTDFSCLTGYYYDNTATNYVCASCSDIAADATCTGPNAADATSCQAGYYLNGVNGCVTCEHTVSGAAGPTGSVNVCASLTTATSCKEGYYLDTDVCVACPVEALACSASGVHTKCAMYFGLVKNVCVAYDLVNINRTLAPMNEKTICQPSYYLDNSTQTCMACAANVRNCTSFKVQACNDGYYLSGSSCSACATSTVGLASLATALTCSGSGAAHHLLCKPGFYLSAGACNACFGTTSLTNYIANSCVGTTKTDHLECRAGYYATRAEGCQKCHGTTSSFPPTYTAKTCTGLEDGTSAATDHLECAYGYVQGALVAGAKVGCTIQCATGTETCTGTAASASLSCKWGYFLEVSAGAVVQCKSCGTGAGICQSETVHALCKEGYYIDSSESNPQCQPCTGSNVKQCVKTICSEGTYLDMGSGGITQCTTCGMINAAYCRVVKTNVVPTICYPGYLFTPASGNTAESCDALTDSNTNTAIADNAAGALTCVFNFVRNSDGSTGCEACNGPNSGCMAAADAAYNTVPISGYGLKLTQAVTAAVTDSGACASGVQSCAFITNSVDEVEIYFTAQDGYHLSAQTTVAACGDANAKTCSGVTDATETTSCIELYQAAYYLNIANNAVVDCQACTDSYAFQCTSTDSISCTSGYSLIHDGTNLLCHGQLTIQGNQFNTSTTLYTQAPVCIDNYFFDYTLATYGCTGCSAPEAKTCIGIDSTDHTSCMAGYTVVAGTCTGCHDRASNVYVIGCSSTSSGAHTSCTVGAYLASGVCTACGTGAISCDNSTVATVCYQKDDLDHTGTQTAENYYLSGVECLTAQLMLQTTGSDFANTVLTSGSQNVATTCDVNYFKDGNACSDCTNNAAACTSTTPAHITQCKETFALIETGTSSAPQKTCVTCGSNIKHCSSTLTTASGCSTGYQLKSGQCHLCPVGSSGCNNLRPTQCSQGYYQSSSTLLCEACGTGAATCSSTTVHTTCLAGYVIKTGETVCAACSDTAAAATCTKDDVAVHLTCQSGYVLVSGTCTQCNPSTGVTACLTTDLAKATSCDVGYYLRSSDQTCVACGTHGHTCPAGIISQCNDGYYVFTDIANNNAKVCRGCPSANAKTCDANGVITCLDRFFKQTVNSIISCQPCPYKSTKCSDLTSATTCLTGTLLSSGVCIDCPSNTDTCGPSLIATGCNNEYKFTNSACVACPANAKTCSTADPVDTCNDGYYKSSDNTQCNACGTGAKTCTSDVLADTCYDGYYKNGDLCEACGAGVKTCTDANTITDCLAGYDLVNAQCIKCPENALECSSTTVATVCNSTYVALGGKCILCLPGTSVCDAPVNTCNADYYLDSTLKVCTSCASTTSACNSDCTNFVTVDTTTCVKCGANALTCSSPTAASTCVSGYYASQGTCTACPTGSTCDSATSITGCLTGYFDQSATVTGTRVCLKCSEGALVCATNSTASSCITNYYLDASSQCQQCNLQNTLSCVLKGFAQTCNAGYYPNLGKCQTCVRQSTACPAACLELGFFTQASTTTSNGVAVTSNSCVQCGANALKCHNDVVAISCKPQYYLKTDGTCSLCNSNTERCDIQTSVQECSVGFVNINGVCESCPQNFATCSNSTHGSTCKSGFYLSGDINNGTVAAECNACPSPARTCSSQTDFQSCIDGYYPTPIKGNDVSCTECPSKPFQINCYNSTYSTLCQEGYYSAKNGTCYQCKSNTKKCPFSIPSVCYDGFLVNATNLTDIRCDSCDQGVKTCKLNETNVTLTIALTCKDGFGLSASGKCVACSCGEKDCPESGSKVCYDGFNLNSVTGKCECPSGFVASSTCNKCDQCSSNCNKCSSSTNCETCAEPYVLQTDGSCAFTCGAGKYVSESTATTTTTDSSAAATTDASSNSTTNTTNSSNTTNTNTTNSTNSTNAARRMLAPTCLPCPDTCANCTSKTVCTSCKENFQLDENKMCSNGFTLLNSNIFVVLALLALLIIKQ